MGKSISINLMGVSVDIISDNPEYLDYLLSHFNKILTEKPVSADIKIEVNMKRDWKGRFSPDLKDRRFEGHENLGASTLLKDRNLVRLEKIRNIKFRFEYDLKDRKLSVKVLWHDKVLKNLLQKLSGSSDGMILSDLTYYFVYYPVFWFLEKYKSVHVLHAAAVKVGDKTLVLSGLEGMGKTSLSLELLNKPGSICISDNLIFYDSNRIYQCYQPVKVRPAQEASIPEGKLKKIKSFRLKTFYQLEGEQEKSSFVPDIFLFLRFGKESYCRQADKDEFARSVYDTNFLVYELENYIHYSHLLNLISPVMSLEALRTDSLRKLLDSCRCYYFAIQKGEKVMITADRIQKLIG